MFQLCRNSWPQPIELSRSVTRGFLKGKTVIAAFIIVGLVSVVVSGSTIHRTYRWYFGGKHFALTHGFSSEQYRYFQALPRVGGYSQYSVYATDLHDDQELASLIGKLEAMAKDANLNVWETLNLIIAFVQSIPYASEEEEYARYPLETLVDQKGDCEDSSILMAAILQQLGYPVVLLVFMEEKHIGVGIAVSPPKTGKYWLCTYGGQDYYYLETTCAGWPIGLLPERYKSKPEIVALTPRTWGYSPSGTCSFGERLTLQNTLLSR